MSFYKGSLKKKKEKELSARLKAIDDYIEKTSLTKQIQKSIKKVGTAPTHDPAPDYEDDNIAVYGSGKTLQQEMQKPNRVLTRAESLKNFFDPGIKPTDTSQKDYLALPTDIRDTTAKQRLEKIENPKGKGFVAGLESAFDVLSPDKEYIKEEVEKSPTLFSISRSTQKSPEYLEPITQEKNISFADIGKGVGEIGKQLMTYGMASKVMAGKEIAAPLVKNLSPKAQEMVSTGLVDLIIDNIAQAPSNVIDAIEQDKSIDEVTRDLIIQNAFDVAFNTGIGIGAEYLKSLKNKPKALKEIVDTKPQQIEAIIKEQPDIAKELGLEGTSAQEFLKQQEALGKSITQETQIEQYYKQFDKTAQDIVDDFNGWVKETFGGNFGAMNVKEEAALKMWYKEATGIDVDISIKEALEPQLKGVSEQLEGIKEGRKFSGEPLRNPKENQLDKLNQEYDTKLKEIEKKVSEGMGKTEAFKELNDLNDQTIANRKKILDEIENVKSISDETLETVKRTNTNSPRQSDIELPVRGKSLAKFPQGRDLTTKELEHKIKKLELSTTTNEARTQLAKRVVKNDFETAVRMVKEGDQFGSGVESEIGREIVGRLQYAGRHAEAVEVIEALSKKFRRAGEDVQAASIWSRTTPEGMQKWAVNTLAKADVKVDKELIKEVGQNMKMIDEMSPNRLALMIADRMGQKESSKIVNSILASHNYEQLKALNTAITMDKVLNRIPIVKARTLSTVQAMSHLLNARTFLRNIFGNTASITGEVVSRVPASIVDRFISMYTGNRSVLASMPKFKQALNEGWKQGQRSFFEISAGVSKGRRNKYDLLFGSAFKSKIGKSGEKLLSLSLQTPDEFFKGFTKADSLYNQVKARLGNVVDDMSFDEIVNKSTIEEIQTALRESEFVTFQNDSALANFMSKTKSLLNRMHIDPNKKFLKEIGEFGLGDLTIKYTRVPGNIITRGFEYSPMGYLKLLSYIHDQSITMKNLSPQLQRQISMELGRATTGSGLLFTGYLLSQAGVITGTENTRDYDVQAFNRAEGLGDYRVNVTALQRLIRGEDPTAKEGDVIKSYNWAQPMTTPIAVGARMFGNSPKNVQEALTSIRQSTIEEALDLPTMFVMKKMMYEGMKEGTTPIDVLAVPAKEALPGFVPSFIRQTAQTLDPVVRDTSNAKDPIMAKIKSNIPGLSKELPAKIDSLGREQKGRKG